MSIFRNYETQTFIFKRLDYCQKALDKMDDIDGSSALHIKPRGFLKKINMIENLPFV